MRLQEKHLVAIREYMKGRAQHDCMLIAGYSESTAMKMAPRFFKQPDIKREIERRQMENERKAEVSRAYLIEKLKGIIDNEEAADSSKIQAITLLMKNLGMLVERSEVSVRSEQEIVKKLHEGRNRLKALKVVGGTEAEED